MIIFFTLVFNPFHFPCPLQLSGVTLSFHAPCKTHATSSFIPCKTLATFMQNPRKKSRDTRTSNFVSFSDNNISLIVLYDKNIDLGFRVHRIQILFGGDLKVIKSFYAVPLSIMGI